MGKEKKLPIILRLEIPNQMLLLRVWRGRALLVTVWLLMTD